MGHNTDFLTKASLNMLHVLTVDQRAKLIALARSPLDEISEYGDELSPAQSQLPFRPFRREMPRRRARSLDVQQFHRQPRVHSGDSVVTHHV